MTLWLSLRFFWAETVECSGIGLMLCFAGATGHIPDVFVQGGLALEAARRLTAGAAAVARVEMHRKAFCVRHEKILTEALRVVNRVKH